VGLILVCLLFGLERDVEVDLNFFATRVDLEKMSLHFRCSIPLKVKVERKFRVGIDRLLSLSIEDARLDEDREDLFENLGRELCPCRQLRKRVRVCGVVLQQHADLIRRHLEGEPGLGTAGIVGLDLAFR